MKTFTLEQIQEADEMYLGFCAECGAERECCEPDARNYQCDECDECGENAVFGARELALMGLVS